MDFYSRVLGLKVLEKTAEAATLGVAVVDTFGTPPATLSLGTGELAPAMEARLIGLASQTKRCTLDNGNAPALPSLSESDAADADGFLAEMLLCFPVLGLSVFSAAGPAAATGRTLYLSAKGVKAEGRETAEGFVVRMGSAAVKAEVPSCHAYLKDLRTALVANGVLKPDGDRFAFAQDYVFPSPSTAAGVVLGRSANGRVEWKTTDGKTLKQLQETEATS